MNKLIINQDVLLRTPISQVRRQIKHEKKLFKPSSACSSSRKHLLSQPKNLTVPRVQVICGADANARAL
jgi:hypothetical protein